VAADPSGSALEWSDLALMGSALPPFHARARNGPDWAADLG
jgi:hypothetical protein